MWVTVIVFITLAIPPFFCKSCKELWSILADGKIVDTGKFAYLMGNCKEFAEFMEECRVENEKKEKEEVKTRKGTLDEERTG